MAFIAMVINGNAKVGRRSRNVDIIVDAAERAVPGTERFLGGGITWSLRREI